MSEVGTGRSSFARRYSRPARSWALSLVRARSYPSPVGPAEFMRRRTGALCTFGQDHRLEEYRWNRSIVHERLAWLERWALD